jgi:ribulose 1,5-bisphosphate synthetase/thiazole synthase
VLGSGGEPEWPSARHGPGTTNLKTAIIVGAGPAGLTAAYELLTRTDIVPTIIEKSHCMGGLARTVNYKGNRIAGREDKSNIWAVNTEMDYHEQSKAT